MNTHYLLLAFVLGAIGCSASTVKTSETNGAVATTLALAEPTRIRTNGVELHYVEQGSGDPIVFVHGGLMDYREWAPVATGLADKYRALTYSRRYNYPNDNPLDTRDHSALVEAEDLAALIDARKLGPAHIVGVSYGGLTALHLALKHPELVRSLVVVEPPLIGWLPHLPGGAKIAAAFIDGLWKPAGEAFRNGDAEEALRVTLNYFIAPGAIDQLPQSVRTMLTGNVREWEALTTSGNAFPLIAQEEVRRLRVPVLVITGERGLEIARLTDPELARLLPMGKHLVIPGGTHDVCSEQPAVCAESVRRFISNQ